MQGVEHNGYEELTLIELLLQLEGDVRRRLTPIRVTPLQAGVLLFLRRHGEARATDAATALRLSLPTMSTVVKNLVRKRWVTKRRLGKDDRVVCLLLSPRGSALTRHIEQRARHVEAALAEQDRRALGMSLKRHRAQTLAQCNDPLSTSHVCNHSLHFDSYPLRTAVQVL